MGKPKKIRPGTFMVTYTPPFKPEPDVALISARVTDARCAPGFIALPLLSERKVEARVAPNARVTLKIGKAKYGVVFTTLQRSKNWVKVRHESGKTGWVARSLLWGW